MALPRTKPELKRFIKRKLGGDFVPVEISDEQLEDITEEAINFFQQNYYGFSKDVCVIVDRDSYLKETGTNDPLEGVFQFKLDENVFSIQNILKRGILGLPSTVFGASTVPSTEVDFIFSMWGGRTTHQSFVDVELLYQQYQFVSDQFLSKYSWDYNSNTNILYIYNNMREWQDTTIYCIGTVFDDLDNDTLVSKYYQNNEFIKYVELLAHCQMYNNLKKFGSTELPGGLRIDIDAYNKNDELKEFKQNIIDNYADPTIYGIHMLSDD